MQGQEIAADVGLGLIGGDVGGASVDEINIALDLSLRDPESYGTFAQELAAPVSERLARFAQRDEQLTCQRVLALLLAVDPIVHPTVYGTISAPRTKGEPAEQG